MSEDKPYSFKVSGELHASLQATFRGLLQVFGDLCGHAETTALPAYKALTARKPEDLLNMDFSQYLALTHSHEHVVASLPKLHNAITSLGILLRGDFKAPGQAITNPLLLFQVLQKYSADRDINDIGNESSLRRLFDKHSKEIAAIIERERRGPELG